MKESTLCDFFNGELSAAKLELEVMACAVDPSHDPEVFPIESMEESFQVRPQHLIRILDATLAGELSPSALEKVASILMASERYLLVEKDNRLVLQTCFHWTSDGVTSLEDVEAWRNWLRSHKSDV
jgi:hypothetical protein